MAKNQEFLESPFSLHALEAQQGTQRFPCSRTGEDKHILLAWDSVIQSTTQQLDQLLLPLTRLNHRGAVSRWKVKKRSLDGGATEDESF